MSLPALLEQRLRLPVVAAPMFLVSNPQLVLACCRGGIVGSFPALNQRESSGFKAWLEEIEAGLATLENPAPYAVNLIVRNSNPRLQADLEGHAGSDGVARKAWMEWAASQPPAMALSRPLPDK